MKLKSAYKIDKKHFQLSVGDCSLKAITTKEFAEFVKISQNACLYKCSRNITKLKFRVNSCSFFDFCEYSDTLYLPATEEENRIIGVSEYVINNSNIIIQEAEDFYNEIYYKYIIYCKKNRIKFVKLMK